MNTVDGARDWLDEAEELKQTLNEVLYAFEQGEAERYETIEKIIVAIRMNQPSSVTSTISGGAAKERALLVKIGGDLYAIPLAHVIETVRLHSKEISKVHGQEVYMLRGSIIPFIRMANQLGLQQEWSSDLPRKKPIQPTYLFTVIVGIGHRRACLAVDQMIGNDEIELQPLGGYIGTHPFVAGASILKEGGVALVLNVSAFIGQTQIPTPELDAPSDNTQEVSHRETQLITFRLEKEQYALEMDKVKEIIAVPVISRMITAPPHVLGMIQLRGQLVPVFDLRQCLQLAPGRNLAKSRILIMEWAGTDIGVMVDQVTEILKVDQYDIEKVPRLAASSPAEAVRGVYKQDDRVIIIISIDHIIELTDVEQQLKLNCTNPREGVDNDESICR